MFLFLSVTCHGLLEDHSLLPRKQVYFIMLLLTKINVSGTSEWGKSSVETIQYLKHSICFVTALR